MKINYNDGCKNIEDLKQGECFAYVGDLYIKTDEIVKEPMDDIRYRCVRIDNGFLETFCEGLSVDMVNAEVVVK